MSNKNGKELTLENTLPTVLYPIEEVKHELRGIFGGIDSALAVAVIGSFANKKYYGHGASDLDVLVVCDHQREKELMKEVEKRLGRGEFDKISDYFKAVDLMVDKDYNVERGRVMIKGDGDLEKLLGLYGLGPGEDVFLRARKIGDEKGKYFSVYFFFYGGFYWRNIMSLVPVKNPDYFKEDRKLVKDNKKLMKFAERIDDLYRWWCAELERKVSYVLLLEEKGRIGEKDSKCLRGYISGFRRTKHWIIEKNLSDMKRKAKADVLASSQEIESYIKTGKIRLGE